MTGADFREAYAQHKDLLYRFARRMTGSNEIAEDLVQECFLRLWSERAMYRPERGSLRGFLVGVIRNLALKRMGRYRSRAKALAKLNCRPVKYTPRLQLVRSGGRV